MNAARKKLPTTTHWIVRRQGRVVQAEAFNSGDGWRFRLMSCGHIVLQRCFVSLSSARRYWQTIREALGHDGWR